MQEVIAGVKTEFQTYADRGIFQNFSFAESANGNTAEFRFHWLEEKPFLIKLNANKPELLIKDFLPAVPYRSDMDKAFREFLIQRCDESILEHRRLDGERFSFVCSNRQAHLSVTIGFKPSDAGDAAKTAVNLLHEIFNNFLLDGPYQNYMVEVFNVPEE